MLINRKTHDNTHAIAIRYKNGVLIILALIGFFIILYYNNFSFSKLLFRGFSENYFEKNVDFNTQYLLFSNFIRPIPFVCFVCAVISKASLKIKAFLFTIMLFSIFPTGLARNAVAMYWIPVLLLLCRPLRKPNVFILVLLFGLLVIFPFLDNFRYFNGTVRFNFSLDYLDTMNFDASQELMVAMKWNFITYGEQLLGVLLFFVPRSIWPTKPIGSGALLANQQAGTFANISMPYFGEGYINFGILGVIAFTIILAYFSAYMDSRFWNKQKKDYLYSKFGIYYLIFIGAILFILRGDLLSSLSYTLGVICSFYVFSKFGFKPEIKKNHV